MSASADKHLKGQRFLAILLVVVIVVSIFGAHQSTVWALFNQGTRVPVLLFGVDAADASRHTDTLMLSVFDPGHNQINLISVPRDTRIRLKGYRFRRINEIYGYHLRKKKDRGKASTEVIQGLSQVLSSESQTVDVPFYFQIDYSGFAKTIDLIGGVWVRIKQPMHYDDFAGNYHFHKEPGLYLMGGRESLKYVRFRGKTGDRGRILRQQEFLRSTARRLVNPMIAFRIPQLIAAITSSIHTNLKFWDMVYLIVSSRHVRAKDLGFYILPGAPRGPYWKIRPKAVQNLMTRVLFGEDKEVEDIKTIIPHMDLVTVKVWNASNRRGMAQRVTRYLRSKGFDVVDWGNYPVVQVSTRVIDRRGHLANAQKIAETLGVETIHSESNAKTLADVEVVLGKNYQGMGAAE